MFWQEGNVCNMNTQQAPGGIRESKKKSSAVMSVASRKKYFSATGSYTVNSQATPLTGSTHMRSNFSTFQLQILFLVKCFTIKLLQSEAPMDDGAIFSGRTKD